MSGMLYNKSNTIWMSYGIEFIKKHIGKTPQTTKTSQSDPKRRKPDIRTMSTLKMNIIMKIVGLFYKL